MPPENQNQFQNQEFGAPKKPNTLLWAVLLIILFVAGSAAGYFILNKEKEKITEPKPLLPDTIIYDSVGEIDLSDWQTYRNEEYGFEFRYPADWSYRVESREYGQTIYLGNPPHPGGSEYGGPIFVQIRGQEDIEDYQKRLSELNRGGSIEVNFAEGISVGFSADIKYSEWEARDEHWNKEVALPLPSDGYLIFILEDYYPVDHYPEARRTMEAVFNQILSTFRFIE
jgi:hypothetical protein